MINQVFEKTVAAHSDRLALVEGERQFSYFELHVYVEWMARYFQSLGVQPGHRVAIFIPNTHEFAISLLGLLRLRGVAVPLITSLGASDLRTALEAAKVHAIITVPRYHGLITGALSASSPSAWPLHKLPLAVFEEDNIATSRNASLPHLREHAAVGARPALPENGKKTANGCAPSKAGDEEPAALFFEKEGERRFEPRPYTHQALLAEAEKLTQLSHLTCSDCILSELTFAHRRGFVAGLLAVIAAGAKMILAEPADEAARLEIIATEGVTIYSGDPAHFERLVEAATDGHSAKNALRLCWCDGAALPTETVQALQQRRGLGLPLL